MYWFKNDQGKDMYVLYYDHDDYVFDALPVKMKDGTYLYNHPLEGYYISKTKQDQMELVHEHQDFYLYKAELENDGQYQNYVIDKTPPSVYLKVEDDIVIGPSLHTNKDFELVIKDDHLENNQSIQVIPYQLKDGEHTIPYLVKDELGNEREGSFKVVVDKTSPTTTLPEGDTLYLNQPLHFELKDDHLNLEESAVIFQEKALPLDDLVLNQSGELRLHLEDHFGNQSNRCLKIVYDDECPTYHLNIEGSKMTFDVKEPLTSFQLQLNKQPFKNLKQELPEGRYELEGVIEDRCGNRTFVKESFCVDVTPPSIVYPTLNEPYYTNEIVYEVIFDDRFLKSYQLEVYLNNERIHTFQGSQPDRVSLSLDDHLGRSCYRVEGVADDGIHQQRFSQSFMIDRYLKKVNYLINQTDGSKVSELMLLVDTEFQTLAPEGQVTYYLYCDGKLRKTKQGASMVVSPKDHPTHLKIEIVDDAMHKEEKLIYFKYPQEVVEKRTDSQNDDFKKESTPLPVSKPTLEKVTYQTKPISEKPTVKENSSGLGSVGWMSMGGMGCVMLIYLFRRYLASYHDQAGSTDNLSDASPHDTVCCDQDATLYLDESNQTNHRD